MEHVSSERTINSHGHQQVINKTRRSLGQATQTPEPTPPDRRAGDTQGKEEGGHGPMAKGKEGGSGSTSDTNTGLSHGSWQVGNPSR